MPPSFRPQPGQIDYTHARWAPVINCVVKYKDKFLVVQRSEKVGFYPGYWNGISGFLDDDRSLEEKVRDELHEELGIQPDKIVRIHLGEIHHQDAPQYKKTWIVHPVLVEVDADEIMLDWEARNFKWVNLTEVKTLNLLPGFEQVIERLKPLLIEE